MARPPNLLLLFPDQWRGDWLGCAGEGVPVRTPNIDALAAAGTRFAEARTNSPLCATARACLATGRRYPAAGVAGSQDDLPADAPSLFRRLRDAGYAVATCGKNDLRKGAYLRADADATARLAALGFSHVREHGGKRDAAVMAIERRADRYVQFLQEHRAVDAYLGDIAARDTLRGNKGGVSASAHALPRMLYTDDFCGADALALLEALPRDRPWCLWVNFPGPHEPFDPPAELLARYDGIRFPDPVAPDPADATDHQAVRRAYAAMMSGIDDWVGTILAAVAARGERDTTIAIFASDHGEMLGDHGKWGKSVPFDGALRVPLIVAGPGLRAGAVSAARAELADVAVTLLAAAGIAVPDDVDARSLLPVLRDSLPDDRHRSHQYAALGDWRALLFDRYKAVRYSDGRFALHDRMGDPGECTNRASALPKTAAFLAAWLARYPEAPAGGV
jgi:arylsulfatase A-like enzyme